MATKKEQTLADEWLNNTIRAEREKKEKQRLTDVLQALPKAKLIIDAEIDKLQLVNEKVVEVINDGQIISARAVNSGIKLYYLHYKGRKYPVVTTREEIDALIKMIEDKG